MFNGGVSNPHDEGHGKDPGRAPWEPMPPVQDGESGEIPRPKAVDTAYQAVLASAVIGALGTVVTYLLDRDELLGLLRSLSEQAEMPLTDSELTGMVGMMQAATGFGIAIFLGLWLLFATKMRAGRYWARTLITILTVFRAMAFLSAMATSGAELDLMWALAEVAFLVTAVVYMFRKESTAYFVEHRRRRLARRGYPR